MFVVTDMEVIEISNVAVFGLLFLRYVKCVFKMGLLKINFAWKVKKLIFE